MILANPCTEEEWLCNRVRDLTGQDWLAAASNWLIARPMAILVLLVLAWLLRWVLHRVINRLTKSAANDGVSGVLQRGRGTEAVRPSVTAARRQQRADTMGSLLKSVITVVIFAVVAIMVVDILGYNIAPLIASAGIIGLALGFGAQTLVKDFISGIFMIFEDQYGVGDIVDVGEATGEVESVGLRVTRLRALDGAVWYVRNGEILRVGNMSQNWARPLLDVRVNVGEDIARVREVLADEAEKMWQEEEYAGLILEKPDVWGVESLDTEGVLVRLVLRTVPSEQWNIARELRQRIQRRFNREGIEIPQRIDLAAGPPR